MVDWHLEICLSPVNHFTVFGINESPDESSSELIKQIAQEKLNVSLRDSDIDRCHRVGKPHGKDARPRALLVKLTSYQNKLALMKARRKLKSSGIVITEDLTQQNQSLLKETQKLQKVERCWSWDGRITALVKLADGR